MSGNPVRLSALVNLVAQEGPPVPGNRNKLTFFHEPRIRGRGITGDGWGAHEETLRLEEGELVIAWDRGRHVWQYTGTIVIDDDGTAIADVYQRYRQLQHHVAQLESELAEAKGAAGWGEDNAPALGGERA